MYLTAHNVDSSEIYKVDVQPKHDNHNVEENSS